MKSINLKVLSPTHETPVKLTKEDVWGKYNGNDGMVVSKTGEICSIFHDKVAHKSVTVVCDADQVDEVSYWLEYVHGGGSISKIKKLENNKVAIRSDYQCW